MHLRSQLVIPFRTCSRSFKSFNDYEIKIIEQTQMLFIVLSKRPAPKLMGFKRPIHTSICYYQEQHFLLSYTKNFTDGIGQSIIIDCKKYIFKPNPVIITTILYSIITLGMTCTLQVFFGDRTTKSVTPHFQSSVLEPLKNCVSFLLYIYHSCSGTRA